MSLDEVNTRVGVHTVYDPYNKASVLIEDDTGYAREAGYRVQRLGEAF